MDNRSSLWEFGDMRQSCIEFGDKRRAEVWIVAVVPTPSRKDVGGGCPATDDFAH